MTTLSDEVELPHAIDLRPYAGNVPTGPVFGAQVDDIPCFVEHKRRLVRDAKGAQVVAESTVYCDLRDDVTPESEVDFGGQTRSVLAVARHDYDDQTPNHLEISLR